MQTRWAVGQRIRRTSVIAAALVLFAGPIGYLLLEKRPGYGAYYGIAKLTGARLDLGPVDFKTLRRRTSPNDALVCAAGQCPNATSDREARTYAMPPQELLARLTRIALDEPRTQSLYCGADCDRTARFIQYSRIMRYPDTIDVAVFSAGEGQSSIAIYSRSLVGYSDFGVNRARVERWLAALDQLT
jgi:uncharacterized protein (DUF1499 family)